MEKKIEQTQPKIKTTNAPADLMRITGQNYYIFMQNINHYAVEQNQVACWQNQSSKTGAAFV